ncbi:hypothetical protein ACQPXH_33230 (plasmid) [Nocardia sp. CA-135953]|uniref:hypothetical protein n=1 Tax=Nocardia sp. CA-135953 TaxID=3239978 RepID=UPI003D96FC74
MAVSLTEAQVRDRSKTVTRRMGWRNLSAGERLTLCRKVMGRRRADGRVEPLVRIVDVEVLAVQRERLDAITPDEVVAEGFPEMTPEQFVDFFCGSHRGCTPDSTVTRIQWRYLPPAQEGLF